MSRSSHDTRGAMRAAPWVSDHVRSGIGSPVIAGKPPLRERRAIIPLTAPPTP